MSKRPNFFAIGFFVSCGAALACAVIIIFGSGMFNRERTSFLATFQGSSNGLKAGAKVKAYGVEVGVVEDIFLHYDSDGEMVVIPVIFILDTDRVLGLFQEDVLGDKEERLANAMANGIYARLASESLVTGMLYIDLAFGLEEEGYLLETGRFGNIPAIPTVPNSIETLMRSVQKLVSNLGEADFAALISETEEAVGDVRMNLAGVSRQMEGLLSETRSKLNSPEAEQLAKNFLNLSESLKRIGLLLDSRGKSSLDNFDRALVQLEGSLLQLESTTRSADAWLSPDSPVYSEAVGALDRISDAARSLRSLIDYLERNPNALLTGRKTAETP